MKRLSPGLVQFRPRQQFALVVVSYEAAGVVQLFRDLPEAIAHAMNFYFSREPKEYGGKPQYEHITIIDRWRHKTVYEVFTTLERKLF